MENVFLIFMLNSSPCDLPQNSIKFKFKKAKKIEKSGLTKVIECAIIYFVAEIKQRQDKIGLSPNGKATDSDSVISRFESL